MTRPTVSVVMPFYGGVEDARTAIAALNRLALRPGDELIIADNSPSLAAAVTSESDRISVVEATDQFGSYYARNLGAEAARAEWVLFLDSDCTPPADLLDLYFQNPPEEACGIRAGGVEGAADHQAAVARWSHSRSALRSDVLSDEYDKKMGVTANLAVRRRAWESVGGFQEGIRSHGDTEFCWRVQEAGWRLEHVPEAAVRHRHRETVRALGRLSARYGAGAAWLNRRRPGSCPRPNTARGLLRCALAAPFLALTGRLERARFKLIDAVAIGGNSAGYLLSNRPPERKADAGASGSAAELPATAIVCDSFPVLAETFIAAEARALADDGMKVRVEAVSRPERPNRRARRGLEVSYIEDEGYLGRIVSLLALVVRHPLHSVVDAVTRRRWPAGERVPLVSLAPMIRRLERWGAQHVHAHFATGAAVTAARVARFLGVPHSVTAHAYEIFSNSDGLRTKLRAASFVTTGCEYNVRHLRREIGSSPPIEEIVMGVDLERFRREQPYPGGRRVLAVGRLVPKKGFVDLIEAAARLEADQPLDQVAIVGDGPLRDQLERRVAERGLEHRVSLLGGMDPEAVRDELERADLLAMPCVVAPDGDRDSMPVVVKEALAMEVPVVGTEEVGLPELVRPEFGRLVPPGDPAALASAVAEILALDPSERARMGSAGRACVVERADVARETRRLAGLIAEAGDRSRSRPG